MAESVPKVSVLIPIYNVEKYLRQCLESVVGQTLQEIEIICLNDGSTDGSLEIVKEFAAKDPRIVIIDKKNSGYGDSMNQGLEKARGEYIGIVESDDWVDRDAFEKLYNIAKLYDVEVVRANYYFNKANEDEKNYYITPLDAGRVVDPARHTWIFLQAPAIWSAIYKREFLDENEIRFLPTPGASYQDTGFNFKVWAMAHRAFFTTEAFLHYRIDNETSSVNNPGKVMNVVYEYDEIEKYLKEKGVFDELMPTLVVAKLGAYVWNIERLIPKYLPDFVEKAQEDLRRVEDIDQIIDNTDLHNSQKTFMKKIVHQSPKQVTNYTRVRKIKKKIRSTARKAWIATHPSYKKQQQISELVNDLFSDIDLLELKLKTLEKKNENSAN